MGKIFDTFVGIGFFIAGMFYLGEPAALLCFTVAIYYTIGLVHKEHMEAIAQTRALMMELHDNKPDSYRSSLER